MLSQKNQLVGEFASKFPDPEGITISAESCGTVYGFRGDASKPMYGANRKRRKRDSGSSYRDSFVPEMCSLWQMLCIEQTYTTSFTACDSKP